MARDPNPATRNPDYLAEELLDDELMKLDRNACSNLRSPFEETFQQRMQTPGASVFLVVTARTKHIDSTLEADLDRGVRQVVILGAGFDTRAYRMSDRHPSVRFFEVDSPATQETKKQRVAHALSELPAQVVYVPIDFQTQSLEEQLSGAGFQADQPTFFVWEGVTMYLTEEAVNATLEFVGRHTAHGSSIIFDYALASVINGTYPGPPAQQAAAKRALENLAAMGEPWLFGAPDEGAKELVERHGFELVSDLRFRPLFEQYLTVELADRALGKGVGRGGIAYARLPGQ